MLQRIYGTAWRNPKELEAHLHQLEEAEKRDHRKLGKEMDLFHLQEEAVGCVFWHPHGWTLFRITGKLYPSPHRGRWLSGGENAAADRLIPVQGIRPLGSSMATTCSRSRPIGGEKLLWPEADELPRPCADLQPGHEELPRPAVAPVQSLVRATATNPPARCMASCECVPSPRTMRIFSAPRRRLPKPNP